MWAVHKKRIRVQEWLSLPVALLLVCVLVGGARAAKAVTPPTLRRPVPTLYRPSEKASTASSTATAKPSAIPAAPRISAASAVLMDAASGKVLFSRQPHVQRAPASLTKIVTGLVAVEKGKMSTIARVSSNAAKKPPTRLGLNPGDRIRLSMLMDAALMGSNNDAATVIAEHIAGSEAAFARQMNETARRLGATNSNFKNPHGLDASGHYSTAYDMALISKYALANTTLSRIFTKQQVHLVWTGGKSQVVNINSFLWRYQGALGLKTGYTNDAGYSVSAAARKNGKTLIVILMGCPNNEVRWNEATHLMDWGFRNYTALMAAAKASNRTYTVKKGDTLYGIAKRLGVTASMFIQANTSLKSNPDRLLVGQKLVIP